jgi:predicted dehydrogenase
MATANRRVLVVGAGSIGARHTRCFLKTGRVEVGICEPNTETREKAVKDNQLADAYATLDDAFAKRWHAVLIATPAHTHISIALRAIETGAALLIEKPLATNMEDVEALQNEVRRRRTVAAVSYNYRAHPGVRAMKGAIDDGNLGKPLQLVLVAGQDFASYRPAYRDTYFADHATGGGAVQDALTHLLNIGEWLVGPITAIAADASHQRLDGVTVEDTVSVIARHGGVSATYSLNLYQKPNETTVTVICENGVIRYELHKERLRRMTKTDGAWHEESYALQDRDDWYIHNANAFLDVVERRCAPLCSLDEAVQTLRATLAAQRSIQRNPMEPVHP